MNLATDWLAALGYALAPWAVLLRELPWLAILAQLGLTLFATLLLHHIGTPVLGKLTEHLPYSHRVVRDANRAAGMAVFLMLAQIVVRNADDTLPGISIVRHISALGLIVAITWLGLRCVRAITRTILELHPVDSPDNLQARRIHTQTKVLGRTAMVMIVLFGSGAALMTLPLLRQIGTSLLASAGVAGLVVGFAAKPVLGNLLAGMQIALTQPIRLDDVVIVQNEWGQIEEITGTYVVVRLWDQRRMVVPLQWFIENPFQNWTRTTSDLLGTVLLWADYRLPVDALRREAEKVCRDAPEWDGRLCITHVVETSEHAMQVRVLVSAADAGKTWDLRCRVREKLIDFIQREYPHCLPHLRTDIRNERASDGPGQFTSMASAKQGA
jgi:small-conductance mechanosensitive channel